MSATAVKKPKHLPYRKLFGRWKGLLRLVIFGIIFLWAFFFIPDPVIEWVVSRVDVAKRIGGEVFASIVSALFGTFAIAVIGDPVHRGNFKASEFFRGEFPSAKIARDFNVDAARASQLFIDYYDTWQFNTEIHYEKYLNTTRIHFECLIIFIMRPVLLVLLVLSLPFLTTTIFDAGLSSPAALGKISIWLIMAAVLLVLILQNRLPSSRRPDPTGCWAAWRRRCEENYSAFRTDLANLGGNDLENFHRSVLLRLEQLTAQAQ